MRLLSVAVEEEELCIRKNESDVLVDAFGRCLHVRIARIIFRLFMKVTNESICDFFHYFYSV